MALTPEDKADVKGAMGKAIANKVSKVTRDKTHPVSDHSQWLTQQVKKDNPAYYALERRALKARRNDTKDRHISLPGGGRGVVKKPENMQRNPVLSPKSKALQGKSGGPSNAERSRMQAEIKAHAKTIPMTDIEKNPHKYRRND
jgi:hypothetical protein